MNWNVPVPAMSFNAVIALKVATYLITFINVSHQLLKMMAILIATVEKMKTSKCNYKQNMFDEF